MTYSKQEAAGGAETRLDRVLMEIVGTPWKLGDELARLKESDPDFTASVVKVVGAGERSPGVRYLVDWLLESGLMTHLLSAGLETEDAETLLRAAMRIEPFFEVKLLRWLMKERASDKVQQLGPNLEQVVVLIDRVSPGNRLLPLAVQLLRLDNDRIRSKSALILAQRNGRAEWALQDPDPRVRANAVEALWGKDTPKIRHLLKEYSKDPNNRVIGNALLGLLRLREPGAFEDLVQMSQDPREPFRSTAAWVMGASGDPRFLSVLDHLSKDPEERVRDNAAKSIVKLTPIETTVLRPLEVHVLQARQVGSRIRLWTAITGLEGAELAVRVEAEPGGELETQVRGLAPEAVDLGFLLPKRSYMPRDTAASLDVTIRKYFSQKRAADRGMVLRYGEGPAIEEAGSAPLLGYQQGIGLVPLRKPRAQVARYTGVYSSSFEPEAGGLEEAVEKALAAGSRMQASVNLLVVGAACGDYGSGRLPKDIAPEAFVHAILAPGATENVRERLAQLTSASRGILLEAADWREVPELVARLCHGLLRGFELLVSQPETCREEQRLRLRILQTGAAGETTVALSRAGPAEWICRKA